MLLNSFSLLHILTVSGSIKVSSYLANEQPDSLEMKLSTLQDRNSRCKITSKIPHPIALVIFLLISIA